MNEQRNYPVTVTVGNEVINQFSFEEVDRKSAVRETLLWFWEKYKGKHGPASEVLTVGDPYTEVVVTETFNCNDKVNNYLDEATLMRVIAESAGTLERETKAGTRHHPKRSLKRVRRRRERRETAAPNIHVSDSGKYYYRIVVVPQKSSGGNLIEARKVKDIKLEAKSLTEAIEEIRRRGLKKLHEMNTARKHIKVRSLKLVAHVSGITPLSANDLKFFAPVLKNHNERSST
ncbi:MAG: hypothetical protein Q7S86_00330 [bacterium]|nr:hypothetical protein [bacterium]